MIKKKMIILTIIAAYLILLSTFKITYSNQKYIWEIEYKGLIWVGLDYWSIWKYDSDDKPVKWLDWKRTSM